MSIIPTKINKESLTTKLTLIIVGLTAGSGLLIPATYASFHPVTSGEIADGTIQSVDIGNGQVRTEDIGTGQVRTGDILDGQVYSVDIRNGQVGSSDIQDDGITSADLGNVVTIVQGLTLSVSSNAIGAQSAHCPSGKIVTGGGFFADLTIRVIISYPQDDNTWQVQGFNAGAQDAALTPYALCV